MARLQNLRIGVHWHALVTWKGWKMKEISGDTPLSNFISKRVVSVHTHFSAARLVHEVHLAAPARKSQLLSASVH